MNIWCANAGKSTIFGMKQPKAFTHQKKTRDDLSQYFSMYSKMAEYIIDKANRNLFCVIGSHLGKKIQKNCPCFFLVCKCLGLLHAKNGVFACICTLHIHVLLGLHCTGIFYGTGLTLTQINKNENITFLWISYQNWFYFNNW